MTRTKKNAQMKQVNEVKNAANVASANPANVCTPVSTDENESYVLANLSAYSGKCDALCKSAKAGLIQVRKGHDMFNGLWVDTLKGQSDENFKKFLSIKRVKNDVRMECDHIHVAMQLNGEIIDNYYLLAKFVPRTDKYVTYDEAGLRTAIAKNSHKKHNLIVLGYQYNGVYFPTTEIEKISFLEKREEEIVEKRVLSDGTIELVKKQVNVVDEKTGLTTQRIAKHVVEREMVPVLTDKITPNKFAAALNRAIAKNWLRIFGEDTAASKKESK